VEEFLDMAMDRSSGLLLHVTSLPSHGGIGDLGPAAYAFADFLAAAKQQWWQVLPLGPTGYGNSPYAGLSAFAGNPLLVSLEFLAEWGWLDRERLGELPGHEGHVDFEAVSARKLPLLEEAARNFLARRANHEEQGEQWERFERFRAANAGWLTDWALYSVLRRKFGYACWNEWPEAVARREPEALAAARKELAAEIAVAEAIQFAFDEQWMRLRNYCAERGIRFLGDIAIFVNFDSADVWAYPEIFDLDEKLSPVRVAGVPPDYFSATGQRWGNPLYRWDVLERQGFAWWVERVRRARVLYDAMRLDHFRGFEAYWSIPAEEETAVNGEWVKAPGDALFETLARELGELPFLAEDLGVITPEVDALRERFGLPGMRVLQFGFSGRGAHMHLPHRYERNSVVYTGTHDNDTTRGWWEHGASREEKAAVEVYLHPGLDASEHGVVWAMIRAAATSVADICLYPVQDVLELGSEARMNVPARAKGNWGWRVGEGAWNDDVAAKLALLTEVTDRDRLPDEDSQEA
jgi:4-alpha-glucanotransferase